MKHILFSIIGFISGLLCVLLSFKEGNALVSLFNSNFSTRERSELQLLLAVGACIILLLGLISFFTLKRVMDKK